MIEFVAHFLRNLGGSNEKDVVSAEVREWLTHLAEHAGVWIMVMQSGIQCPCGRPAIAACRMCQKPHCLAHSFVSWQADTVCFKCVGAEIKKRQEKQEPGPGVHGAGPMGPTPKEFRKKYLKTLGLKDPASQEEIKKAYRELALKCHPDRFQKATPAKQAAAEKKLRELNAAYDWLNKNAPSQSASAAA